MVSLIFLFMCLQLLVILLRRSYASFCIVTIRSYETRVDFILLNMFDFQVILGMDWLSLYHIILYCHSKTVMLDEVTMV